jgi:hypothetical protein
MVSGSNTNSASRAIPCPTAQALSWVRTRKVRIATGHPLDGNRRTQSRTKGRIATQVDGSTFSGRYEQRRRSVSSSASRSGARLVALSTSGPLHLLPRFVTLGSSGACRAEVSTSSRPVSCGQTADAWRPVGPGGSTRSFRGGPTSEGSRASVRLDASAACAPYSPWCLDGLADRRCCGVSGRWDLISRQR